jgi:hypothetical protein
LSATAIPKFGASLRESGMTIAARAILTGSVAASFTNESAARLRRTEEREIGMTRVVGR